MSVASDRRDSVRYLGVVSEEDIETLDDLKLVRECWARSCCAEIADKIGDGEGERCNHSSFICDRVCERLILTVTTIGDANDVSVLDIQGLPSNDHGFSVRCNARKLRQLKKELNDTGELSALDFGVDFNIVTSQVQVWSSADFEVIGINRDLPSHCAMSGPWWELATCD